MHVAILGNGVTGVSAALELRRRRPEWRITLISGESRHHWSRPALMYIFMGHMRYQDTKPFPDSFWGQQKIELLRGWVTRIDGGARRLELADGAALGWDRLLLATGSRPNRFGWPGQDLDGVQGLYGLPDLLQLYETTKRTRRAVIVGGGLIGIELAEMLVSRNIPVTFLVRERSYWDNVLPAEESAMVNRVVRRHGLGLELATELGAVEDDGRGRCAAAVTADGRRFPCELVGLTAGVSPNLAVVEGSGIETGRGVLVDSRLATSLPGVWAAGDCAEIVTPEGERNLIQQVWYTGKMQGETAAANIAGEERDYDPGIWFNSAKFFDLEYQTYGRVNFDVPGERNLYWEHPSHRHAARVVLSSEGSVIGLQTMGLRWRHQVAERWIAEARPADEALASLPELAFDPELHRRYEGEMRGVLEEQLS
ncbi:MAG: FAD/NAD(P)-binding oxidoreductase [Thermoanaerobaculia bacterium]|nr:FAD/NAD(P)-binding oxidoreductase [Thermoanaerobaculia bacterium]